MPLPTCRIDLHADANRPAPSESATTHQRWTIADFQAAYMNGIATPQQVAENVLKAIAASEAHDPPLKLFAAYDAADLRRQAAESTRRCSLPHLVLMTPTCSSWMKSSPSQPGWPAMHMQCMSPCRPAMQARHDT